MPPGWLLPQSRPDVIGFTATPTASAKTVTLKNFSAPYNCYVDWGDGQKSAQILFPTVSFPTSPSEADLVPFGVTLVPDPEPAQEERLADARAEKLARLGDAFEHAQRFGHFGSSLGFEVDANERANRDVTGLVTMLTATGEEETLFCDYGNVMRRVTLAQLQTLQVELIAYGQMLYARKWTLRETIESAETVEAVAAIEINFDDLPAPVVEVTAA